MSEAINYILSSYSRPRRKITLIGHSMGGIVAQLALAEESKSAANRGWNASDIAAVITMSAPHSLAPARLDTTIENIYKDISHWEKSISLSNRPQTFPPIISICGGSTDSQIPSETCSLPTLRETTHSQVSSSESMPYRRTVHSTSLPGVWTGVGHREMVWCHQVRWRVARALLALGNAGPQDRDETNIPVSHAILDRWFPLPEVHTKPSIEGHSHSDPQVPALDAKTGAHTLVTSATLRVSKVPDTPSTYVLPMSRNTSDDEPRVLSLVVERGTLLAPKLGPELAPHHPSALRLTLYHCVASKVSSSNDASFKSSSCQPLGGQVLKSIVAWHRASLLPLPSRDSKSFPDKEGVDESEGLLYFAIAIKPSSSGAEWIAIRSEGGSNSENHWFAAGFDQEREHNAVNSRLSAFVVSLPTHLD